MVQVQLQLFDDFWSRIAPSLTPFLLAEHRYVFPLTSEASFYCVCELSFMGHYFGKSEISNDSR